MKKIFIFLALCLSVSSVFAEGDDNNCAKLSIMITNTTNEVCTLEDQSLNHGFLHYTGHVPAFLPAGSTSQPFVLSQSAIFGPDIDLTYVCGNSKRIQFHTKQDYCFFTAGHIHGGIMNQQNMSAKYTATDGSAFWSQHGTMNWLLSE